MSYADIQSCIDTYKQVLLVKEGRGSVRIVAIEEAFKIQPPFPNEALNDTHASKKVKSM